MKESFTTQMLFSSIWEVYFTQKQLQILQY